jgi:hypothetical protein
MSVATASGPLSDAGAAVATEVPGAMATSARCENCGAAVSGRYCATCGQRLEPPLHSLWHFSRTATEDLTHADSRLWRTLGALLFRPGYLTREFLAGRRARYLPPVRLYLVVSVVFFLWASATHHLRVVLFSEPDHGPAKAVVAPLDAGVVYGQGRALTLGKLVLLSFFYLVSGVLMIGLVTLYSVFTL